MCIRDRYVSVRPWTSEFLREAARHFEVVVFTAAEKKYADKVVELLDPNRNLVTHLLYRNSCLKVDSLFIKDLDMLGRDLAKTIIVDNSPISFAYQVFMFLTIERQRNLNQIIHRQHKRHSTSAFDRSAEESLRR
eukprot:TRINITY_DN4464_c0_g2_i3.p1 TRINITY_DN4464_c0_g2~~TRINITY_DN4464_c0_g2_i3.p1  ORF type:complete len:135 (+),score=10.97 TRINITY_DN4464_c0_g2_i3:81-485(+)